MTNYFLDLVKRRKTTFEFAPQSVPDAKIKLLLEAARWAPSCTNSQPWHFVVVKNKERIAQLMKTANYGFFHEYPPLIIACVLRNDQCAGPNFACYRDTDSNVHDTFMSVGIAAYNICLEAEDLGISSCLLTPEQEAVKKILKIKKEDHVPLLVGVGYEKKGVFKRSRKRRDLKSMVSSELFKVKSK